MDAQSKIQEDKDKQEAEVASPSHWLADPFVRLLTADCKGLTRSLQNVLGEAISTSLYGNASRFRRPENNRTQSICMCPDVKQRKRKTTARVGLYSCRVHL
jgi:hypothetical protein